MHRIIFFILAGILVSSCSLFGGGDNLKSVDSYKLNAPAHWEKTSSGEADRAYRLPSGAVVSFISSCEVETTASLEVLSKQLLIGSRERKKLLQEQRTLGANKGLYSIYSVKYQKTPFEMLLFNTKQQDCIFDFTLVTPNKVSEEDKADFNRFIESFHYGN